jgi:hypothetical protein
MYNMTSDLCIAGETQSREITLTVANTGMNTLSSMNSHKLYIDNKI